MIITSRKNGIQSFPAQKMQFHMFSIHSPHRIRKTIMNEWKKSLKCHLSNGGSLGYWGPKSCIPTTAKMKMMMARTKQRLPRAPNVRPMIEMRRFKVGQDFASLNTRSCRMDNENWDEENVMLTKIKQVQLHKLNTWRDPWESFDWKNLLFRSKFSQFITWNVKNRRFWNLKCLKNTGI